jgi:hypothetical protein
MSRLIDTYDARNHPQITITVVRALGKSAPDLWGRGASFAAGERVSIGVVPVPTKPGESWAFWTNPDVDLALIFLEDEVAEISMPAGEPWQTLFVEAPCRVTLRVT